jgi:hypothetical protein
MNSESYKGGLSNFLALPLLWVDSESRTRVWYVTLQEDQN